jgi:hypothetical protein
LIMSEPTKAELTEQLTEMTRAPIDRRAPRANKLTLARGGERSDRKGQREAPTRHAELEALRAELRSANASLKAHKGAATKARNEATIVKQQLSPEAAADRRDEAAAQ